MDAFAIAARLQLNVHDLNNEATAGNVTDIRIMEYIDLNGQRCEAPAVSGRMVKHWHQAALTELARVEGVPLCTQCAQSEPLRPPSGFGTQADAIRQCIVCDVHGFLIAEKGIEAVEGRRTSRANFSWLMPVLDEGVETAARQVIHNRVSADPEAMMPYYKSYASGIYGFVSSLEIDRIGVTDAEHREVEGVDRVQRARLCIQAYRHLLSGQLGASQSHAVPHTDCPELLVAFTDSGPLPNPISPIYPGYAEKYVGMAPPGAQLHAFGIEPTEGITVHETIGEVFDVVLNALK